VDVITYYGLNGQDSIPKEGNAFFLFITTFRIVLRSTQPLLNAQLGPVSWINQLDDEADH
jgi:hypothetical protein